MFFLGKIPWRFQFLYNPWLFQVLQDFQTGRHPVLVTSATYERNISQVLNNNGLTLGTNIRAIDRKQQNIKARATNAKLASCWDAITMVTGAVMRHKTTTL